ncbi:MAG: DedA family protein [Nitrososphaerales archaeon]
MSGQIFQFAVNLTDKSGYYGIFALMVMESATLPIPSEVVLPLAGYLVFLGQINFWVAVLVASIGSLVGTMIDYSIGYYLGRPAILRYGSYLKLNEKHLVTSEKWFNKYGNITVLLARFVPLIRTLVAFPAGVAEMKVWKFLSFSALGIFIWDGLLIYTGVLAGRNSSQIISSLTNAFTLIEVVIVIGLILSLVLVIRRHSPKETRKDID